MVKFSIYLNRRVFVMIMANSADVMANNDPSHQDLHCLRSGLTRQPLWVILCRLPEKREKRVRRDSKGDDREGQGRKRNRNGNEETEEII